MSSTTRRAFARNSSGVTHNLLGVAIVAAVVLLSACSGVSPAAFCEAAGGDWVGSTCAHRWTQAELDTKQWCETHGGVYLGGDHVCAFGFSGP